MARKTLPDEIDIQGILEADVGFRVEFSKGMRAPVVNGEVTLQMCWRADCYTKVNARWQHLITIVDDTPAGLFAQLGALSTEGKVRVRA